MPFNKIWEARHQLLVKNLTKAALDLFEHTNAESYRIAIPGTHPKLWIVVGEEASILDLMKDCSIEDE